jgi:hypothetical protein
MNELGRIVTVERGISYQWAAIDYSVPQLVKDFKKFVCLFIERGSP